MCRMDFLIHRPKWDWTSKLKTQMYCTDRPANKIKMAKKTDETNKKFEFRISVIIRYKTMCCSHRHHRRTIRTRWNSTRPIVSVYSLPIDLCTGEQSAALSSSPSRSRDNKFNKAKINLKNKRQNCLWYLLWTCQQIDEKPIEPLNKQVPYEPILLRTFIRIVLREWR